MHSTVFLDGYSLFFLLKKHLCPNCKSILVRKKREKMVHSESDEAKKHDLLYIDGFLYGWIKLVSHYYECPECKKIYEIKELKNKKRKRRKDTEIPKPPK